MHTLYLIIVCGLGLLSLLSVIASAIIFHDAEDEESKAMGGSLFLLLSLGLFGVDLFVILVHALL